MYFLSWNTDSKKPEQLLLRAAFFPHSGEMTQQNQPMLMVQKSGYHLGWYLNNKKIDPL